MSTTHRRHHSEPAVSIPPEAIFSYVLPNKLVDNVSRLLGLCPVARLAILEFYRKHKGNCRDMLEKVKLPVTWETLILAIKCIWQKSLSGAMRRRYIMHGQIAYLLWSYNPNYPSYRPLIPEPPEEDPQGHLLIVGDPFLEPMCINVENAVDYHIQHEESLPLMYSAGPRKPPPYIDFWPDDHI